MRIKHNLMPEAQMIKLLHVIWQEIKYMSTNHLGWY